MSKEVEYTVAITAFWDIEAVYQDSFTHCLEEDCKTERWGNEALGQYCHSLREIANHRLEKAPDEVVSKAEVVFLRVLEHEVDFWNMNQGKTLVPLIKM